MPLACAEERRTFARGADKLCQQDRGDVSQASRHDATDIVLHGPRLPLPDSAPLRTTMQHNGTHYLQPSKMHILRMQLVSGCLSR